MRGFWHNLRRFDTPLHGCYIGTSIFSVSARNFPGKNRQSTRTDKGPFLFSAPRALHFPQGCSCKLFLSEFRLKSRYTVPVGPNNLFQNRTTSPKTSPNLILRQLEVEEAFVELVSTYVVATDAVKFR